MHTEIHVYSNTILIENTVNHKFFSFFYKYLLRQVVYINLGGLWWSLVTDIERIMQIQEGKATGLD